MNSTIEKAKRIAEIYCLENNLPLEMVEGVSYQIIDDKVYFLRYEKGNNNDLVDDLKHMPRIIMIVGDKVEYV